jgi:hypothetical protein
MKITVNIELDKKWNDIKMKDIIDKLFPNPKDNGILNVSIANVRI